MCLPTACVSVCTIHCCYVSTTTTNEHSNKQNYSPENWPANERANRVRVCCAQLCKLQSTVFTKCLCDYIWVACKQWTYCSHRIERNAVVVSVGLSSANGIHVCLLFSRRVPTVRGEKISSAETIEKHKHIFRQWESKEVTGTSHSPSVIIWHSQLDDKNNNNNLKKSRIFKQRFCVRCVFFCVCSTVSSIVMTFGI